jgi:penicillin-binding protein 2
MRSPRVLAVQVVVLAMMLTLGARLAYLQTVAAPQYIAAANANTVREVISPAPRGLILDDQGRPLAGDRSRIQLSVDRAALAAQPDRGAAVLKRLAGVLSTTPGDLRQSLRTCTAKVKQPCWNGSPYQPVPVAGDVDPQVALSISERRELFPGVRTDQIAVREYTAPYGANAAHVLGYVSAANPDQAAAQRNAGRLDPQLGNADLVGQTGLERHYDELLRGTPGVTRLSVDHLGNVLGTVGQTPAAPGHNLVTTIDARVQAIAERELLAAIDRARHVKDFRHRTYPADSGSVVVLDVNTGAVVAMASAPTFDPAVWVGGITPGAYAMLTDPSANSPLLPRAYGSGGPPGSTFKVVSSTAALESGYSTHSLYDCNRSYRIADRDFGNFESEAYGPITLQQAIEVSCDTVFYKIAYEMWQKDGGLDPVPHPADPMQTMATAFGLGRLTGIDLPGESAGRIADRDWKQRNWQATKERDCDRARTGYPDLAQTQPTRAAFLQQVAADNCARGYRFGPGDAANFAIGQGDTIVTPLQLARMYAAVANGGTLWRPHVAKAELGPDGRVVRTFSPVIQGRVPMSKATLAYLRQSLVGVTTAGTAAGVYAGWPLDEIPVAAKTGTAEHYGQQPSSWFAGYLPAGPHPRYAVVMTVSQGGTGSGTSGPSVRAIEAALLGVDRAPVLPHGKPPVNLPTLLSDGTYRKPQ